MKILGLFAGAFALVLGAGSASAVTIYNLTAGDTGPWSASCSSSASGCSVSSSSDGLGVDSSGFFVFDDPNQIEASFSEALTITFLAPTELVSFTLGEFNPGFFSFDDFDYALDGGAFVSGLTGNPQSVNQTVNSFTVRASGVGSFFGLDSDKFTLASFTTGDSPVAAVPLPGAGFLFVGALGGLAALRRRRKLPA